MFALEQHTIFLTLAGSQAHGTARQGSDVDLRGVCIAPLSVRLSLFRSFEQYEGALPEALGESALPRLREHPTAALGVPVKTECVVFDIAKFVGLCAAANPNTLEILFADERDWVLAKPTWRRLYDARRQFLTKQVHQTFLGYALAQLKKIQTHRSWLLHPPARKPTRQDFGLPVHAGTLNADDQNRIEQALSDKLRSYGVEDVDMPKASRIALQERLHTFYRDALGAATDDLEEPMRSVATHALGIPSDVATTLNAEKRYRAAQKHWDAYETWKRQRNPTRAELERTHGYDTKHAMHLIRLMRMGLEVLETGELNVRRPDAAELSAIRDGALSYDQLIALATSLRQAMLGSGASNTLPDDVDRERVDNLLASVLLT